MNKYSKLFALLGSALLLGACQEESLLQSEGPLSGNEIRFGATAHFKNGNSSTTRTVYGDVDKSDDGNGSGTIEVRWSNGDCIDIACPSTAGTTCAEYVVSNFDHGTDADGKNQDGAQSSYASTLTKTGDVGLQWGSSEEQYTFYSVYPSLNTLKSNLQGIKTNAELKDMGVSHEGILNGYLPHIQDAVPASVDDALKDTQTIDGKEGYVIEPNMDFAYMVAKASNISYGKDVTLSFESIVTALEFQIFAPDVVGESAGEVTVTSFALSHMDNGDINGPFSYNYNSQEYNTPDNGEPSDNNQIHMKVLGTNGKGVTISKDQFIDVTFFLLPRGNGDEDSYEGLQLSVFYKIGDAQQTKSAIINKEIKPRTKTYIKNIKLPKIENVNASSWWSAIPLPTLLSQVSIPVAGNVYATGNDANHKQQTKTVSELWKMGVRGFELCCQTTCDAEEKQDPSQMLTESLGSEPIIVAENFTETSFDKAVKELLELHSTEGYENEPLILLCTYASKDDGYNPYNYVANLLNYFNGLDDKYKEKFVQITSNTTAENLRGGIAVVIRPGNDLRWAYETLEHRSSSYKPQTNPYSILGIDDGYPENGLTAMIPEKLASLDKEKFPGIVMLDKVMIVSDWGNSSYDMWNRRYGNQYAMDATSYDKLPDDRKTQINKLFNNGNELLKVEYFLLGSNQEYDVSSYTWSGNVSDNDFNYYGEGYTAPWLVAIPEFNFTHSLSNGGNAYVQEWQRVVNNDISETKLYEGRDWLFAYFNERSIWTKWPSSIDEKKEAIKDLFNLSVMTKGGSDSNDLFINVLSGYYAYAGFIPSITPIIETVPTSRGNQTGLTDQGKGGNYQGLAKDLNEFVYNLLSATPGGDGSALDKVKQQGPWGLVVMDHIGTEGDGGYSQKLVDLIVMNNFRFPLATYDGE